MARTDLFPWRISGLEWARWRQSKHWPTAGALPKMLALLLANFVSSTPVWYDGSTSQPDSQQVVGQTPGNAEIERLFTRYQAPLLDYLFGMTHDHELAADLLQETFVRALSASQAPGEVNYPQAWLYRIATNTALNASRRQRRFRWLPLGRLEPSSTASSSDRWPNPTAADLPSHLYDDFAVAVAERDAVWRTLIELPPRWRAILLLQTTAGFSAREIASSLGLEEGNVRKILFRAKERFRTLYTQLDSPHIAKPPSGQRGQK